MAMGCCMFFPWPSCVARHGYRALEVDDEPTVRVVVGKERRVFFVDPFVLQKQPFRVLLETGRREKNDKFHNKDAIFVDVDDILFEHMLWLVYNDSSSTAATNGSLLFDELNLKEIIEFYSMDY